MLYIIPNPSAQKVADLLRKICPEPMLIIDLTPSRFTDESGAPVSIGGSGKVVYPAVPTLTDRTCARIAKIANSKQRVTIEMVPGSFISPRQTEMRDEAGMTSNTTAHKLFNWGAVEILLDGSDGDGGGYWVLSEDEGTQIPLPMDAVLAHELGHAEAFIDGRGSNSELPGREAENEYRMKAGLPKRKYVGKEGDRYLPLNTPTTPRPHIPRSSNKPCVIATAALGSPLAPDIEFLRNLRDNILRKTRTGKEYYDWFYERYYKVSPDIVAKIEADPDIKSMVRWIAITPIVQYLELLATFPTESLAEVPEPWHGFLTKMNDRFEDFVNKIEAPTSFKGISTEEAVIELALILRYRFRTSRMRQLYLQELTIAGALPLPVNSKKEITELQAILTVNNHSLDPEDLILSLQSHTIARGVFGRAVNQTTQSFVYVCITNHSTDEIRDIGLAYKRSDMNISTLLVMQFIPPGGTTVFCLGTPRLLQSFAFRCYIGGQEICRLRQVNFSDPSVVAHRVDPNVYEYFIEEDIRVA